jgi:hypothetical protein
MVEMVETPSVRSFLTGSEGNRPQPLILPLYVMPLPTEQEQFRILLISSSGWVRETIHDLHRRSFANAND